MIEALMLQSIAPLALFLVYFPLATTSRFIAPFSRFHPLIYAVFQLSRQVAKYYGILSSSEMADSAPEIIYGAAAAGQLSTEDLQERLYVLRKHNVNALDTAFIYV